MHNQDNFILLFFVIKNPIKSILAYCLEVRNFARSGRCDITFSVSYWILALTRRWIGCEVGNHCGFQSGHPPHGEGHQIAE